MSTTSPRPSTHADEDAWAKASAFMRVHRHESQAARLGNPPYWTIRDEANVLAAFAFRNGFLEGLHGGPAGFSDKEMRKLMIESSAALAELLYLARSEPELYAAFLLDYGARYTRDWERVATEVDSAPILKARGLCAECGNEVRSSWAFCPSCGERWHGQST